MNSLQKVNLHCLLLLASMYAVCCQSLTSTLLEGGRACPGVQVNFTCTTSGSLVMAWRSNEYIGPNGAELEFTSADGVGTMMTSTVNPNTVATLVELSGSRVTESLLSITVLDSYQTASVTCSDVGQGASTVTFQPLELPGIPRNITAVKVASTPVDDCVIVVRWKPPNTAESSIQHYVIDSPSGSFITRNTSIEIALLVYHCEVETYIGIHAVDYCDRNGLQTNGILAQLLTSTNTTFVPFTASTTEINNNDNSCDQRIIIIIVLGSLLGAGFLALVALSIALCVLKSQLGHLKLQELEQALLLKSDDEHGRTKSDGDTLPASEATQKDPLKKKLYVVRSKDIKEIDVQPLLRKNSSAQEEEGDTHIISDV